MKLGLMVGYSGAKMALPIERIRLAEGLGYDSIWTGEAYGSDAITPQAFIAAHTRHIRLGTFMQLAGRPPAMCAMQAQTVDTMAGGDRMIACIGVSGPQIVEGWYGQPWGTPYYHLSDYIQIMLKIFGRQGPVTHDGREIKLPYPKDALGSSGLGKPLTSILHPNPNLPIWVGAGGPATTRLAAELGQGLFPLRFVPGDMSRIGPWLLEGFARAGNGKGWNGFEIQSSVYVQITDNVQAALAARKPQLALYVGGMGAGSQNYHNDAMVEAGFPQAAAKIQELFLAGRKREAIEAVPDEYVQRDVLFGSVEQISERYQAWADSGATGLVIETDQPDALELMAELVEKYPAVGPEVAMARLANPALGS